MHIISIDAASQWKASFPIQENHTIILWWIVLPTGSILRLCILLSWLPEQLRHRSRSWGSHQTVGWSPKSIREMLVQQIGEVPHMSPGIPVLTFISHCLYLPQKQPQSSKLLFLTSLPVRLLLTPYLLTSSCSSFWANITEGRIWWSSWESCNCSGIVWPGTVHWWVPNDARNLSHTALQHLSIPFAMKKS